MKCTVSSSVSFYIYVCSANPIVSDLCDGIPVYKKRLHIYDLCSRFLIVMYGKRNGIGAYFSSRIFCEKRTISAAFSQFPDKSSKFMRFPAISGIFCSILSDSLFFTFF
ncbi:MAG TPA: hypothetical protein DCG49_03465 [Ruminococcus sp.]|nr:hypothetical protein [Ruminococcus sp.]